ncbi:hypothetical protein [Vibrio mediterranei]|nr:hypothetical protein [Vibrio mediterranei]
MTRRSLQFRVLGERLMDKRITSANTFIDQPQGKENSTDENSSVL